MSALEESLKKVYRLVGPRKTTIAADLAALAKKATQPAMPQGPRLIDGSPLPEGMVPGPTRTMEYRDANQNGIEDRDEGIYLPKDLVPESSIPQMTEAQKEYQRRFFATPPEGGFQSNMPTMPRIPTDKDPLDEIDEETRQKLQDLLGKAGQKAQAPLAGLAEQLAMAGEGEDTALAHLRPGEIVIPPEFMDDASFESALEKKFEQFNINPEEAVVGAGIASLNPQTGLEQFGFFKKLGKKLKKVVKKVAPIAAFIPGVGTALGGVLGGIGGLATKIPGIGGALGSIGSTVAGGIAKLGIPGISSIAGGTAGGFGGILPGLQNPLAGGMFGKTGSVFAGGPEAGKGLANRIGFGSGTPQQVAKAALNSLTETQIAEMDPADLEQLKTTAAGGNSIFNRILGGNQQQSTSTGGGFLSGLSDFGKTAGIGALAAGLGKLAYEDAKKQTGVPLTPLTTMSPTGRYNIEAEIARRTGQPTPNPVEFGLLPEGTIPELSGGKPKGMMYGGPVEDLTGGMAMGMQEGGSVQSTQEVIEEAMEIVQLAEQEPAIKDTPEYQEALNVLQRQMLTAAVMGKGPAMGGIKPIGNPLVGPSSGVASAVGHLANKKLKMRMGRGLKAAQDKAEGIASFGPNLPMGMGMMYGGPVMAYAQGGAVALQEGGGIDSLSQDKISKYLDELSQKKQDMFFHNKFPTTLVNKQKFKTAKENYDNAVRYVTPENLAKYEEGGMDAISSKAAKKSLKKYLNFINAKKMSEGGSMNPVEFPRMDGDINGPGTETSDDIPAMLSDGEFVMTGQAVRGAGSYDMQKDNKGIISLIPSFNENRERGMDLMYKMMDTFAGEAKPS